MPGKIQGSLEIMSLPDVLHWISLAHKTGSLIFDRGKEKKVIFFSKGAVIGANSNSPKDKIGEVLIRMDKLERKDLEKGLQIQKTTGELIGDVFLSRGLLTTQEFVAALERQATQIIYDLFAWKQGDFIFHERLPKDRTIPILIKVDFILMEGMRRVDDWVKIQEAFQVLDTILDWTASSSEEEGTEDEKSIHLLINGKNTILDICDPSPLSDFETLNHLYGLFNAKKVGKKSVRTPHEIMEEDDVKHLLTSGQALYQQGRFGDAIPFFERILKIETENKEADRFLTRSISAVQSELLKFMESPNAVLEIDKGVRLDQARGLSAAEGFLLSRIDGETTAKEITSACGISQTEACTTLKGLFEKGAVRAGRDKKEVGRKARPATEREILDPKKKRMTLDLADVPLSECFLDLIKQRQTGILQIISTPVDFRVYFKEGAVVFATSNMESDRCGSIMLRKKKITEAEYQDVKALAEKDNMLQGNALVKLGYISPNDLIWLTKTKAEEILVSLFGRRQGKVVFFETSLDGLDIIHLKLIPGRIIMEGTWDYYEEEEIIKIFGSWETLFDVVDPPPLSRGELDLTKTEAEILGYVNGIRSIPEIASEMKLQKIEVLKTLFGFYSLGLVVKTGRAKAESQEEVLKTLSEMQEKWAAMQEQDFYMILNLEKEADNRKIQKAFPLFSKTYHPDRSFRYRDPETLEIMLKIFLTGQEAYEILSHPEHRKEYDSFLLEHGNMTGETSQEYVKPHIEVGRTIKANYFLNRAKGFLFSGKTFDALELFEKANELVPDDPDCSAYTGLALARMRKDYNKATQLIEKAIQTHPMNADYHSFLGEAHLSSGETQRAMEAFAEALEINPKHIQAQQEYGKLQTSAHEG